jgi:hypothetical protein
VVEVAKDLVSVPLLKELELLATKWDKEGCDELAEELRLVTAKYLMPEFKVRYVYANDWKTGVVLTRPTKDNPCWQVRRNGYGGWVDQVQPGTDTIRIYVET